MKRLRTAEDLKYIAKDIYCMIPLVNLDRTDTTDMALYVRRHYGTLSDEELEQVANLIITEGRKLLDLPFRPHPLSGYPDQGGEDPLTTNPGKPIK